MRVQPSARLIAVFSSLLNGDVVETYSLVGHNDGLRRESTHQAVVGFAK